MFNNEDWLTVGKIVAAQGLQGELRVNPSSDFPERFTEPGKRWLQQHRETPQEVKLLKGRQLPGKALYVVRFAGVENRTAAEALIGQELLVHASKRPKLAEGEFHLLDLIGLEARLDPRAAPIGHVIGLISGANDLLEIKLLNGHKVLVPFVKPIVPEVLVKEGWLHLTPPHGLLEL